MKLIYIIEDHEVIGLGVRQYLIGSGFDAQTFTTLKQAKEAIEQQRPDLIIQDVMLPDGDGFEFIQALKAKASIPVIFMTAKVAEADRIKGFELGADDYIVKPFSPKELVLRVQALFRRLDSGAITFDKPQVFHAGDATMVFDLRQHSLTVDSERPYLTSAEWRIITCLIESAGTMVSRADILSKCFDYSYESYDRIVDTHIKNIRAKLGIQNPWIETIRGYGYKFIGYKKEEDE
ncbi:MAG: response regulator transcription factor [Sphaerochaetaceae bacterium]|jgi:DNA-binding response OmpR family regulator